ncbi:hypothetical protein V3C99_005879, partial [Haemonchus contortus]
EAFLTRKAVRSSSRLTTIVAPSALLKTTLSMPYSTGSTDSGYCCGLKSKYTADGSTTTSSDRATSSITDDEEPLRWASRRGTSFSRTTRGKSRRLRKKALPPSDTSSRSSCSSSELNSLTGEEERRHTLSREDIIKKIYVYFQSLLVTIRRQQKFFEQIGGLMADADARWGAGGLRKGWVDPAGCFAPYGFGDRSKPTVFPGCWAVPHPAVHLALLASNLRDYLEFLGWLYPGVVGRGAGGATATAARAAAPMDDVSQQRARAPELGVSDDILPILMQLMQQMGPMNGSGGASAPTTPMDEAMLRQEKMRQHLQQTAAAQSTPGWSVQPALMQQLVTQLNQMQFAQQQQQQPNQPTPAAVAAPVIVKKTSVGGTNQVLHSSPLKSTPPSDVTQRPPSEFYSAVVARRSPTYGEPGGGSSKSSASSSTMARHPAVSSKLDRKARATPPTTVESVPLNTTAATTVPSMRDDVKTPCGESGYQSESSPPLPAKSQQSVSNSSSAVVACGSKAIAKPLNSSSNPNTLTSGTQTFAAAAASGLSSSAQASVATATAVAATVAAVVAVESSLTLPTCPTPPTSQLGRPVQYEISEMDVLSEEIWHYHNSVTQSEKMLNRKLHLRDMLYYSICPVFPMCGLYVVGSSLNGFGNNTSDMDLCLMITNKDLDQKTDAVVVLNMILSTLQHTEWVSHQKLILAKVPILRIKFAPPFSDITVDLNANNSVAIKNTHLLCYYSSFDWRVRPLVSVVKEWAKRKGINDANRSSFTSYSLVLMVIHYLQCGTEPGVLPSLQQMFPRRFANKCDVRTLNVTLPLEPPPAGEWQYADKSTLGELLIGFLDYYANKFDYDRDAISVRLGKRIDRAVIARQRPNGGYQQNGTNWRSQWRCICIEEPFTYSNTAHSIYDEMVFDAIKTAFREAHQELDTTRDLQRLLNCKPITVNAPMGGAMVYVSSYSSTREICAGSTAGDSPMSGHSRRSTPRGSSSGSSISTAHSAASSSGSSSSSDYGEDQDHDRMADVANMNVVPLQRHPKSRSRRISRQNGSISSCLPPSPPKIPVTTAAEQ